MIFRFEMDTLEIILKEQLDVVDRFFLAEADLSHKGVKFLNILNIELVCASALESLRGKVATKSTFARNQVLHSYPSFPT